MKLKLYGMTYSNYYNMVKAVLLEKGLDFEEVDVRPSQDEGYLQASPMGKVPALETDQGFLTETGVIIDYLDSLGEGPSFYPSDAFEKAKVQELMRYLELYLELPARKLYGDVFFNTPIGDAEKTLAKAQIEKGFKALARLAKFKPYLAGENLSYADFYFVYSVGIVTVVCKKAFGWNAFTDVANIKDLLDLMNQRESIKQIAADQKAG